MVTCTVTGTPMPNVSISQHNFTVLSPMENEFMGERSASIYIQVSNTTGVAYLMCEAENNHGSINDTFNITVVYPPRLLQAPMVSGSTDNSVSLSWTPWVYSADFGGALGDVPDYQVVYRRIPYDVDWVSGTDWILQASADVTNLLPDSDYEFAIRSRRPLDKGDGPPGEVAQGWTKCRAPNSRGVPRTVDVLTSPTTATIRWLPPTLENLGCQVGNYILELQGDSGSTFHIVGQDVMRFELTDLKPNSNYTLYLSIRTSLGNGTNHAEVTFRTLKPVPGPVGDLVYDPSKSGPKEVSLSWSHPTNVNESDVKLYAVEAKLQQLGTCDAVSMSLVNGSIISITTGRKYVNVPMLYPNSLYVITVQAMSDAAGEVANITVQTNESAPELQPPQVTVKAADSNALTFEWDPIPCHLANGALYYRYSLRVASQRIKRSNTWIVKDNNTTNTSVTIRDLNPSTAYEFQVRGVTSGGEGPPSAITQKTTDGLPAPTFKVAGKDYSSLSLFIERLHQNASEYQFKIQWTANETFLNSSRWMLFQLVRNLTSDTEYTIQARAKYETGWGTWSDPIVARTRLGAPKMLTAKQISDSEVLVQWAAPDSIDGGLDGYKFTCIQEASERSGGIRITMFSNETSDNDTTQMTFDDLSENDTYVIEVSAKNKEGYGKVASVTVKMIAISDPSSNTSLTGVPPQNGTSVSGCPIGYYDSACGSVCNCRNNASCDLVTGQCPNGCITGFKGPTCNALDTLTAKQISYSAVVAQWATPSHLEGDLQGYKIECVLEDSESGQRNTIFSTETSDNVTNEMTFDDLSDSATYVIEVSAKYKVGYGDVASVKIKMVQSPPAPIIAYNKFLNQSTLLFLWRALDGDYNIQGYRVEGYIAKSGDADKPAFSEDLSGNSSMLNITLYDLEPEVYELSVKAITPFGYGQPAKQNVSMEILGDPRLAQRRTMAPPVPELVVCNRNKTHTDEVTIEIRVFPIPPTFQDSSIYYEIIVAVSGYPNDLNASRILNYHLAKKVPTHYWTTGRILAQQFESASSVKFTIGDSDYHGTFFNGPLQASVNYDIMIRASNGSDDTTSFLSPPLHVISLDLAEYLAYHSQCHVLGITCVWFMVIIIAILFLVWVILIVLIVRNRRKRRGSRKIVTGDYSYTTDKPSDSKAYYPAKREEEDGLNGVFTQNLGDNDYKMETFKDSKFFGPIPLNELADYIETRNTHPIWTFKEEFREVTQEKRASWDVAKKTENIQKNRYGNILPYDHSRVHLEPLPGLPSSDYINASYLDGYDKPRVYIATQGPKENTFHDFWRMIYQEKVATIVMLTELSEQKRKKCDQYWPNHSRLFGDILVTLTDTESCADVVVRHFEMKKIGNEEKLNVKHYQCKDWADFDIPSCPTSVLSLRRKMREEHPNNAGPIVVHCSGGAGRTGTFVAIDAMLKQAHDEEKVYVFDYVQKLQAQRVHMVQTVEQYKFIYEAILEALQSGDTKVACNRLSVYYRDIIRSYENGPCDIAEQYDVLNKLGKRQSCFPCPAALDDSNVNKNRNQSIVPVEHSRVRLQSLLEGDNPTVPPEDPYINAVLCNGFKQNGQFLVTQMPMDSTTEDFWHMIIKNKSSVIVMLNDCEFIDEQMAAGQYWPDQDGCMQYGSYQVEVVSFEEKGMVNMRTLRITDMRKADVEPHIVVQLQFLHWTPGEEVPSSKASVVSLLSMTDVMQRKYGGPVTVHCLDGASRSGLFCVCHYLKEQAESGEVDVFNAVKRLRRHRPEFIISLKQYQFCYEVVLEGMLMV